MHFIRSFKFEPSPARVSFICAEMADDVVYIPSSLCHCSDRKAVHVHWFCDVCNGKAVNYRTQISHLKLNASYSTQRGEEQLESELASSTGSDRSC